MATQEVPNAGQSGCADSPYLFCIAPPNGYESDKPSNTYAVVINLCALQVEAGKQQIFGQSGLERIGA